MADVVSWVNVSCHTKPVPPKQSLYGPLKAQYGKDYYGDQAGSFSLELLKVRRVWLEPSEFMV